MQVYQRIANPYMPQGTANATNAPTPFYAPGEIGCAFYDPNTARAHARVKLDSGATSATPIGAVAAGQLAFWKDRANAIVTNDKRFCDVGVTGSVNRVAGVFPLAVTAGGGVNGTDGQPLYYVCDIVIQAKGMNVASDGTGGAGQTAVADTTASTAVTLDPSMVITHTNYTSAGSAANTEHTIAASSILTNNSSHIVDCRLMNYRGISHNLGR